MFNNFELEPHQECSYDHIELFDGDNAESNSLGKFCGSSKPHPIIASSSRMYMTFYSDASVQRKGFHATHTTGNSSSIVYTHTTFLCPVYMLCSPRNVQKYPKITTIYYQRFFVSLLN